MQVEWRGTDQDPDEDDFAKKTFSHIFFFYYLLTVLPPHGEDAHQEGEGGHDYLQKLHQHLLTRNIPIYLPRLGGTELSVATEHLPEHFFQCIHFKVPFDTQCL